MLREILARGKYGIVPRELQKLHPEVKSYKLKEEEGKHFIDIEGDLIVTPADIRERRLVIKVGELSGNLICYARQIEASSLPKKINGNIEFKHPLLGNYSFATKLKLGEDVYFINGNGISHREVDRIFIKSSYDKDMVIHTEVKYGVKGMIIDRLLDEIDVFKSDKEIKNKIAGESSSEIWSSGEEVVVKYALGDNVWFVNNNCIAHSRICGVEIRLDISDDLKSSDSENQEFPTPKVFVKYQVVTGEEAISISDKDIYLTRQELSRRI